MRIKLALLIFVLLINFIVFVPSVAKNFSSWAGKNLVGEVKIGKLWGNFDQLRTEAVEFSGWSAQDAIDLSLEPNTSGMAVYEFSQPAEAKKVILQIALAKPGIGSNRLSVSPDKLNWHQLAENQYLHMVPFDITKYAGNNGKFWVKIEAENLADNIKPVVVLYDLYLMYYRREINIPPLGLMAVTIFIPWWLIFYPGRKKALKSLLLALVLITSLQLSLRNLAAYRYHSFDSDVLCLTQEVPRLLSLKLWPALMGNYCGNKESLNPLIIIGFWQLFGNGSEMAIRFSSLIFHWLTIILVYYFGKKVISFPAGLMAAAFIGTHPYLIELSGRGLRDTAFTFFITLFALMLFETKKWRFIGSVFLGLIITALIYLRLHSIIQLIGIVGLYIFFQRKFILGIVIVILIGLIASPLIVTNLKTYNTWNYSEEMHLKWNANVEFAGQPGFPTKEAMTVNPFQGPKISATTYFFKLHRPADLIFSTLAGVKKTFEDLYFRHGRWLAWLFLPGGWLMLKRKELRYIPVLVFLLEMPHFFLAAKNLVEFRSMTQSLPFIGLTIGYIINELWTKLKRY